MKLFLQLAPNGTINWHLTWGRISPTNSQFGKKKTKFYQEAKLVCLCKNPNDVK